MAVAMVVRSVCVCGYVDMWEDGMGSSHGRKAAARPGYMAMCLSPLLDSRHTRPIILRAWQFIDIASRQSVSMICSLPGRRGEHMRPTPAVPAVVLVVSAVDWMEVQGSAVPAGPPPRLFTAFCFSFA